MQSVIALRKRDAAEAALRRYDPRARSRPLEQRRDPFELSRPPLRERKAKLAMWTEQALPAFLRLARVFCTSEKSLRQIKEPVGFLVECR